VFRPMTVPLRRLFSRNPLIRAGDRLETAVVALAVLLVVVGAVWAVIIHCAETQDYRRQVQDRHAVVAAAVDDSKVAVLPDTTAYTVNVRLQANGIDRTEVIGWDSAVKAGDRLQIWVDAKGNRVAAPTLLRLAGSDAITTAATAWLIVAVIAVLAVAAARARGMRMRDAQWDRSIRRVLNGDVGRTNTSQCSALLTAASRINRGPMALALPAWPDKSEDQ